MIIISFNVPIEDKKGYTLVELEYKDWDHYTDVDLIRKEIDRIIEKDYKYQKPSHFKWYDPDRKTTLLHMFKAAYNREGTIKKANKGISTISKKQGAIIIIDDSEGEYGEVRLTKEDLLSLAEQL